MSHWHHPQEPTALVPTANELLRQCPRLRILVLGKAGAGKSALINRVFGVEATTVQFDSSGVHDITTPLTSKGNDRFVLHDSQGFECGEEGNLQTVLNFIDERAKMTALQDQLHAIWLCIEIPFANGRTFETGDERLLREVEGKVPIFVVFTKLDILRMRIQQALDESEEAESMSDEEFDKAVSSAVNDKVQELCIEPLYALQAVRPYQWAAVSIKTKQELYVKTIEGLISTVLEHLTEKVWLTWAMAQRANANANIKASIIVGKKKYWRGLLSDVFLGFSMKRCLDVLCKDILCVWNMNDPHEHLLAPEFTALVSVVVQDLHDTATRDRYKRSKNALQAVAENPATIVYAGPVAAVVVFAEWVYETFRKSKTSLRCLMGFIVDLTLTMDTVFWLTQQDPDEPLTVKSLNTALKMYNRRKRAIHTSIRTWVEGLGSLERLQPDHAITRIERLIEEHRFNPEGNTRGGVSAADEAWLDPEELLTTGTA